MKRIIFSSILFFSPGFLVAEPNVSGVEGIKSQLQKVESRDDSSLDWQGVADIYKSAKPALNDVIQATQKYAQKASSEYLVLAKKHEQQEILFNTLKQSIESGSTKNTLEILQDPAVKQLIVLDLSANAASANYLVGRFYHWCTANKASLFDRVFGVACAHGQTVVVKELVENSPLFISNRAAFVSCFVTDERLCSALEKRHDDLWHYFVEIGKSHKFERLLDLACAYDRVTLVKELVENNASLDKTWLCERFITFNRFQYAIEKNYVDLFRYFVELRGLKTVTRTYTGYDDWGYSYPASITVEYPANKLVKLAKDNADIMKILEPYVAQEDKEYYTSLKHTVIASICAIGFAATAALIATGRLFAFA